MGDGARIEIALLLWGMGWEQEADQKLVLAVVVRLGGKLNRLQQGML